MSLSPPQTPACPRTPVERLFVDQRRFSVQPACLSRSPAPQFQSQRLYSSYRMTVSESALSTGTVSTVDGQASAAVGCESPLPVLGNAEAAADTDRPPDETDDVASLLDQGGQLLAKLDGQASAAVVQALLGGESPLGALVRHRIAKAAADADRLFEEATDDVAALLDQGGQLLAQLEGQASVAVVQALLGGESPLPSLVRHRIADVSTDSYRPHQEVQDLRRTLFDEDKEQGAIEAQAQGKADQPGRLSDTAEQSREVLHKDGDDHGRMGARVSTEEEQAAEEMAANQAFEDLDQAVTKIQAIARGRSERKRHKTRKARNTQREANDWPLGQRVAGRPSAAADGREASAQTEEEQAGEEMAANQAFADLDQAATKIQAIARGRSERRRHKTRKEWREERREEAPARTEEEQAADEISANEMYRGLESAAIKIQSRARGMSVRKRHDKRARPSHQASPPGRRPARMQEEEDEEEGVAVLADAAETALPDTPVRPRSAMRAHSRRPHTPHAPPAATAVQQETVERKMAKFRQEMLEAVANVQRDYRTRSVDTYFQ